MERTETVIKAFINATEEQRATVLEMLTEDERKTFAEALAWYKLFTNSEYCKAVKNSMARVIWETAQHHL